MHSNFTLKPNSSTIFSFSMSPNFRVRFGFVSNPISGSDFISVSNLTERSDLILVSNLVWKGDSQFNSTLESEMKRSLAKFMINTQWCIYLVTIMASV